MTTNGRSKRCGLTQRWIGPVPEVDAVRDGADPPQRPDGQHRRHRRAHVGRIDHHHRRHDGEHQEPALVHAQVGVLDLAKHSAITAAAAEADPGERPPQTPG